MNGPSFSEIVSLIGDKFGTFDVPCPECGPDRRDPHNRKRGVLRVWRETDDFATYNCARCDLRGHAAADDNFRSPMYRTEIATVAEKGDGWIAILPVPADAPPITKATLDGPAKPGFALTKVWRYLDAGGELLGMVARYDRPANGDAAEKDIRPWTYCQGPTGHAEWRCKALPLPRPLYGLDRLAARPDAPVLVVEGEKAADAAAKRFPDYVAVTSPGGCKAAAKADWSPLKGSKVTIWPDNDAAGIGYAENVAKMLTEAASVSIVRLPANLPDGWDLGDDTPGGIDATALLTGAETASESIDGPIPLFPPMPPSAPFPTDALGPVLSRAAGAIANKVQVPVPIAAQSVLAAAALAAQAHADVMLPFGQARPLSLFLVTVAASGDRKSTADNEALWPIRKREKALKEDYESKHREWVIASAAWNAEKRKIEANKKLDYDGRKKDLADLGPEPERPLHPFLTAPEPTFEGLCKAWVNAPAALGIFSAEGGQFVGGYGMASENRLRTAAAYSEIWDGKAVKRIRSLDGVSILHGRRLSMHLMVQNEAATQFLADPLLRDQGLLSRVLVAAPESIAGTRFYRDPQPEDDAAIKAYGARLLSILESPWPLVACTRNELEPRTLTISAEATAAWREFLDFIEGMCGREGGLSIIGDFAAKAAEHAARIAAVLTIVNDTWSTEIAIDTMKSAITITEWYLGEAMRLARASRTDPRLLQAQQLLDWLRGRDEEVVGFREIIQFGPGAVRTKVEAEQAISILVTHGWLVEISARPRRFRMVKKD